MWIQFFLENVHFAIYLIAGLSFFTVFWLYYDAWTESKRSAEVTKFLGFLVLSLSFIAHSIYIESVILSSASIFGGSVETLVVPILRIVGYLLILTGVLLDPIQAVPQSLAAALILPAFPFLKFDYLYPILSLAIALLYLRRATIGLESHLKKVSLAFFVLTLSETASLGYLFSGTANISVYNFVAPFGPLWIIQHILITIAVIILLKWSFVYLFKRFNTQIFIIFDTSILIIFLLTTVSFTSLLTKNITDETLTRISTDVKVLSLALDTKKAESLSDAEVVANDPSIISSINNSDHSALSTSLQNFLLTKKESFLIVTDTAGKVLARGEDRENYGDSVSGDPVYKRAVLGDSASSVVSKDAVLAPTISVRSGVPIKDQDKIIGTVITGLTVDSAFLDGIHSSTGLEASIYSGNVLSATTLMGQDKTSRPVGIKETDKNINDTVLGKGENYTSGVEILNKSYFASYVALTDIDNNVIGMLFVGSPQVGVLRSAGHSIELTFIITAVLLIISVLPAYFISKYLSDQLND